MRSGEVTSDHLGDQGAGVEAGVDQAQAAVGL